MTENCEHKNTYFYPKPWPTGETVEICKHCGMSRAYWEQGVTFWIMIEDIDKSYNDLEEAIKNNPPVKESYEIELDCDLGENK